MGRLFLVLSVVCFAIASQGAAVLRDTVVELDSGFIEGAVDGNTLSFKGVPYAAPPIGHFRWRATQPVQPWIGVRKTVSFGADCMQKADPIDSAILRTTPAEDCLTANVWRPAMVKIAQTFPVVVWIYGGGFVNGGTSPAIYDGTGFAEKGVLFVSFNYRLGRFGFFAHPALTAASEGPLGNYGLMDQIYALQWVRRNIAAFGGDPNQITVIGESAGGISILNLMTSQAKLKLFDRAIVLSGGGRDEIVGGLPLNTGPTLTAEQTGVNFAAREGITGAGVQALAALRSLPAEKIRGDLNMTSLFSGAEKLFYAGGPIYDGRTLSTPPEKSFQQGVAAKIPIIIGSTDRDVGFLTAKDKAEVFAMFGNKAREAEAAYDPSGQKSLADLIQDVGADKTMNEPARFVAQSMTTEGNKAWLYRFYYVAESMRSQWPGAPHASELPFVFDTLKVRYGKDVTSQDQAVSLMIGTYFTNFVKTGNPNSSGLPGWTTFEPSISNLHGFEMDGTAVLATDPWKTRLDLMEEVSDATTSTRRAP